MPSPRQTQTTAVCQQCAHESPRKTDAANSGSYCICEECGHRWHDVAETDEVALAALHGSRVAVQAHQLIEQAERLITTAEELLRESEARLSAAIERRGSHEEGPPRGRPN